MTNSLIVANNSLEISEGNSTSYDFENQQLEDIGRFAQGVNIGRNFSDNNIDKLNDTLVFEVTNPTTTKLNVNLFGFTNNLFAPINPAPSNLVIPTLAVPGFPLEAAYSPINNFIYTCNQVLDSVTTIDCTTNSVIGSIALPVGFSPRSIVYNPVNNQMYVASFLLAQVIRIDCNTNTIIGPVIVTSGPIKASGLTYNSVNNSIYAVITTGTSINEISCINNLLFSTFLPPGAVNLVKSGYNPTLNRLYTSDATTNNVLVTNCDTNTPVTTILTVLNTANAIIYCSANNFIYVVGQVSNNVLPINCATNIPAAAIAIGAQSPRSIAYNPLNNLIYVPKFITADYVIINPVTNAVIGGSALGAADPTSVVYNSNDNSIWFTFGPSNQVQSLLPLLPPSAIVTLSGGYTLGDLYNDLQGKPLFLKGMKMIVESLNQFFNNITINYYSIYGKQDAIQYQPSNYISPTNAQSLVIDDANFEAEVDTNTDITFDIEPLSSLIMSFTINKAVDNTVPLFKDITKDWSSGTDETTNTRLTGNPVADIVLEQEANKILSESGYNSIAQYAFYPRETGNPVADIALLNQAGFRDSHYNKLNE
jgi:YVTN family beta-propeller protein